MFMAAPTHKEDNLHSWVCLERIDPRRIHFW